MTSVTLKGDFLVPAKSELPAFAGGLAGEVIKGSFWSSFWEYSTSLLIDEDGS